MDKITTNTILSLIRHCMPNMIAKDIIGVQPMSDRASKPLLQTSEDPFNSYPFTAMRHDLRWDLGFTTKEMNDMIAWCSTTLARSDWHYVNGSFQFKNECDRTLFMLRWAS